jgi:hypothetical protein
MSEPRAPAQRPSVLVTRRLPDAVERRLAAQFRAVLNGSDEPLERGTLEAAMREQDGLLTTITDRIDAALIATEGRRVRIVANFGAGTDHIDVDAARRAGIIITNTPDALTEATAELTILLMLMAARRAGEGERVLRAGEWKGWGPTQLIGQGLEGRTRGAPRPRRWVSACPSVTSAAAKRRRRSNNLLERLPPNHWQILRPRPTFSRCTCRAEPERIIWSIEGYWRG